MQFQNHHLSWQWFSFSSVFFNFTFINIRLWTMNYTCILVSQDMRWLYLSPKIFAVVPSHQMRVDGVADLEPCSTQRYQLLSWGFTNYFILFFYPKNPHHIFTMKRPLGTLESANTTTTSFLSMEWSTFLSNGPIRVSWIITAMSFAFFCLANGSFVSFITRGSSVRLPR